MVCYFGGGILRVILGQLLPQDRFDYRTDARSRGLWLPDPSDKFAIERVLHDVDRRFRQYVDTPAVVMVPTSLWRADCFTRPAFRACGQFAERYRLRAHPKQPRARPTIPVISRRPRRPRERASESSREPLRTEKALYVVVEREDTRAFRQQEEEYRSPHQVLSPVFGVDERLDHKGHAEERQGGEPRRQPRDAHLRA